MAGATRNAEMQKSPDWPAFILQFIGGIFLVGVLASLLWTGQGQMVLLYSFGNYFAGYAEFWWPIFIGFAVLGPILLLIDSFASLAPIKILSARVSSAAVLAASFSLLVMTLSSETYFVMVVIGLVLGLAGIGMRHAQLGMIK